MFSSSTSLFSSRLGFKKYFPTQQYLVGTSRVNTNLIYLFNKICLIGGYELTDMDVLKLKKAYGCDGNCGGWAKSETGGLSSNIASHHLNFSNIATRPDQNYQETLTEQAVTMKARANGSWKHLLARLVDTSDVWATNQIK